jgi:hypothetical protein
VPPGRQHPQPPLWVYFRISLLPISVDYTYMQPKSQILENQIKSALYQTLAFDYPLIIQSILLQTE